MAEHFDDWNLTCEYKKILVNTNDEHNDAFDLLELWLDNSFEKYKKSGIHFLKERKFIEQQDIDIQAIEEYKSNYTERCIDMEVRNYINKTILPAIKQLDRNINKE